MDNQPTLKEYIVLNRNNVIMSRDRYFYMAKTNTGMPYKVLKALIYALFIAVIPFINLKSWGNLSFDVFVLWQLILLTFKNFEYSRCSFESIEKNNHDHHKNICWLLSRRKTDYIFPGVVIGLALLFSIANSFSALYVRSCFENNIRISDMIISFSSGEDNVEDELTLSDCENLTELIIPVHTITDIDVSVLISGKPEAYEFSLNGQPFKEWDNTRGPSFIWENDVFLQRYFVTHEATNLPETSVLEISGGSYSRQYIIKTEP